MVKATARWRCIRWRCIMCTAPDLRACKLDINLVVGPALR